MRIQKVYSIFILAGLIVLTSCLPAKSQSRHRGKEEKPYEEDLSAYRIDYKAKNDSIEATKEVKKVEAVAPQKDITKNLNAKLDTLSKNNSNKYVQGFRVLVYSGKRSDEVKLARTKVYEAIPNADIYTDYKQPNQRVKVGNCFDRLEAYSLFIKLRKIFPHAVTIPDEVIIKGK